MQGQQVMSRPVDVINPNATSREAARRMRDEHIGALPVGENDELLGMVTDRDIVARSVAKNMLPGNTAVSSVMSEGVYHCFEDDTLEEVLHVPCRRPRGAILVQVLGATELVRCFDSPRPREPVTVEAQCPGVRLAARGIRGEIGRRTVLREPPQHVSLGREERVKRQLPARAEQLSVRPQPRTGRIRETRGE